MPYLTVPVYGADLLVTKPAINPTMPDASPWNIGNSKGADNGRAITGPQVDFERETGQLSHSAARRFNKYNRHWVDFNKMRVVRRDPTIALAREMAVAPIVGSNWTVEVVDEDAPPDLKEYCEKYLLPLRKRFLRTALYGEIDFGWRAYEKINNSVRDKKLGVVVIPERLKTLLNDTTWAKFNQDGDYDGLLHQDPNGYGWTWLDRKYTIFANFDDDGLGNYNDPRLARVEAAYDEWHKINEVSKRYNEKMAGAVWVVHYPEGRTFYKGVSTDNSIIARDIVHNIKASGYLTLPSKLLADAQTELEQMGQSGWRIEIMESSSKQQDFIAAMQYQDGLKARGLGILERAMMEGQYGTKAEAESHVNVMLLNMQLKHEDLTELFNYEMVDDYADVNYSAPGAVKFVAQPLTDERYELFQSLFTSLVANPDQAADIFDMLDVKEILDHLRIPLLSETEQKLKQGGMSELLRLISDASSVTTPVVNPALQTAPVDGTPMLTPQVN